MAKVYPPTWRYRVRGKSGGKLPSNATGIPSIEEAGKEDSRPKAVPGSLPNGENTAQGGHTILAIMGYVNVQSEALSWMM